MASARWQLPNTVCFKPGKRKFQSPIDFVITTTFQIHLVYSKTIQLYYLI